MTNKFYVSLLILIFNSHIYSQKKNNNFTDISRITIGFHKTNFNNPKYSFDFNTNSVELQQKKEHNFFLDYRLVELNNFSLNLGIFLNSFNNNLKYDGYLFDPFTNDYEAFNGEPYPTKEKINQTEFYFSLNYLTKLKCNLFMNIGVGLSYEKNSTYQEYEVEALFSNSSFTQEYLVFESVYNIKRDLFRINFSPYFGIKTDIGMVNLGFKYSHATKKLLSGGEYSFYDLKNNKEFKGTFKQSGDYISLFLSYNPSKDLFKKKK